MHARPPLPGPAALAARAGNSARAPELDGGAGLGIWPAAQATRPEPPKSTVAPGSASGALGRLRGGDQPKPPIRHAGGATGPGQAAWVPFLWADLHECCLA